MCGISSSQVFFFLAAITGCISVIVNIKFSEDLLVSDGSNFQANGQECQARHKLNRQSSHPLLL
ncbi:hypothetical protein HanHA300_Chr02g0044211 [Helianthus annuus]|nr:hypothetical protein HanHA300_Chr02g0044211 [Helianthus annuus]KAJ0617958.1 hypothetical protein HanHA89_Chr02g0047711 [Helianthus annuus]